MLPPIAGLSPATASSRVVLPQPVLPISTPYSPASTVSERSSSAKVPARRQRWSRRIMAEVFYLPSPPLAVAQASRLWLCFTGGTPVLRGRGENEITPRGPARTAARSPAPAAPPPP